MRSQSRFVTIHTGKCKTDIILEVNFFKSSILEILFLERSGISKNDLIKQRSGENPRKCAIKLVSKWRRYLLNIKISVEYFTDLLKV